MTTEVREALARYRNGIASGICHDDIYGPGNEAATHRTLAAAFAATVRDDDGEPAHVESMMRAAGFHVPRGGFGWCPVDFNAPLARGHMQLTLTMTKGQVRRLLSALGIPETGS